MKVSVITVAFNAETTVGDAVASVASQKGVEVEHLFIDGASHDKTVERAKAAGGANLKVVSEADTGVYDAMNKGFRAATGEIVGFLNADDFLCRTDALALLATTAPPWDAVCGGVAIVDAAEPGRVRRAYSASGFQPWMMRFGHMPPHPGFYIRREALRRLGQFDAELRVCGDFEWMLRFFLVHRMQAKFISETVVAVRAGGISTRGLPSTKLINREAHQSLRAHRIASNPAMIWSKYVAKGIQLIRRPTEYPAKPEVRWMPR
jgi:glycosyltransferase involved in cell wall biosynthesis